MWISISFGLILSTLFDISAFSINTENQQVSSSYATPQRFLWRRGDQSVSLVTEHVLSESFPATEQQALWRWVNKLANVLSRVFLIFNRFCLLPDGKKEKRSSNVDVFYFVNFHQVFPCWCFQEVLTSNLLEHSMLGVSWKFNARNVFDFRYKRSTT